MQFSDGSNEVFTGYYTSRPGLKKNVKVASALLHAQNKLFATEVLRQEANDAEIEELLKAKETVLDALGILNAHNSISGGANEIVVRDFNARLKTALNTSGQVYNRLVA
jgi:hypothetical protein